MKTVGITAEYNPLHDGHVYHINETRRRTTCDAVVVALSGDFVQRGEPAILDKWTRTRTALMAGADLVIEIPVLFCLGDASRYASASVKMLEALGCEQISFGSGCGNEGLIVEVANHMISNRDLMIEGISGCIGEGLSYPAARSKVYRQIRIEEGAAETDIAREIALLAEPNDILGLEYVMNMSKAVPLAIARKGASYNDPIRPDRDHQSAGAIRELLSTGKPADVADWVPECTMDELVSGHLSFTDEWDRIIRYAVLSMSADEIDDCPSGGEGLGNLLKESVKTFDSLSAIIKAVKSKRYTYTRISRLCMQAALGISRSRFGMEEPAYIRVLGFSKKGRDILSEVKKNNGTDLPILTNINKEAATLDEDGAAMLELDVHAADVYNLVTDRDISTLSDHRISPVIFC